MNALIRLIWLYCISTSTAQGPTSQSLPRRRALTLGEDGGLPCELLQHLSSTGQSVSALTDADVQAELANAELSHGVLLLLTLVLEGGHENNNNNKKS